MRSFYLYTVKGHKTMKKLTRTSLISFSIIVSLYGTTACSSTDEFIPDQTLQTQENSPQEEDVIALIDQNNIVDYKSLEKSKPHEKGASNFFKQWVTYVFLTENDDIIDENGIGGEISQYLNEHPELDKINAEYSYFEKFDSREKDKFFHIARRSHIFNFVPEKDLSEHDKYIITHNILLTMLMYPPKTNVSVDVPEEAFSINKNEPITATFNHGDIEFLEHNEEGTQKVFPLIGSPQGAMYDMKNMVLIYKDGRWWIDPEWLVSSINNIENNIKENQEGNEDDPAYKEMREKENNYHAHEVH